MTQHEMGLAIANVVAEWSALLRYFPQDEISKASIMLAVDRLVSTPEELAWLREAMISKVGEWQGAKQLREVFCCRYRPKDGIEVDPEEPVFTAGEIAQARRLAIAPPENRLLPAGTELWKEGEAEERIRAAAERKRVRKPTGADRAAAKDFMERAGL